MNPREMQFSLNCVAPSSCADNDATPAPKPVAPEVLDLLKMEHENLTTDIATYAGLIGKILAGALALTVAIVWYGLEKPEVRGPLALAETFILHGSVMALAYAYLVYRTLKETKRLQGERINKMTDAEAPLIWERVWNEIWGGQKSFVHSKLAFLLCALFALSFGSLISASTWQSWQFLMVTDFPLHRFLAWSFVAMSITLICLEILITRRLARKLGRCMSSHRAKYLQAGG